jgi:hypothetical protein
VDAAPEDAHPLCYKLPDAAAADPASAAELLAQPNRLEFETSDACPDAFQVLAPLGLLERQGLPDAKVRGPASAHPAQAFPALDKSVSPASDWRADASAHPGVATEEARQMRDSVDVAESDALPDPAAAELPASAPVAQLMGDFRKAHWATLAADGPVLAHCSDAVQSGLPAGAPWASEPAASAPLTPQPGLDLTLDWTVRRWAAGAAWALSILGQDAVPQAMSV